MGEKEKMLIFCAFYTKIKGHFLTCETLLQKIKEKIS